ncbi:hypothetical protein BDZ94DRAFT_1366470 [Collybia nuda]|uniref:Transposase n=1 Tax=Collybia nuda TaxID=64659 RepID=A0A9P5XQ17_9AGAR|nr:hypothetical protein BDZ94DRAFT_1366470 [Collybia nuda]
MPNMITISHVMEPLIESGQGLPAFGHPNGVPVTVKLAPLIADLEGSRKFSGFMTHSATCFCSFCLSNVRNEANTWLNTVTKTGRNAQAKKTGVRWTPLHRLAYWDPVQHIVLGYMHNWLEGILKYHLRMIWGIGPPDKNNNSEEADEHWSETDVSESASELEDLLQEAASASGIVQETPPVSPSVTQDSSSSATPTLNNEEAPIDDPDYFSSSGPFFTKHQLEAIQDCISNISLPTWVQRPPTNLGEASHGKIKAHEYLTLFSVIFPLIVPEFWHSADSTAHDHQLLVSFYHLVSATNIISSFKTSNRDADDYTYHYIQYRASLHALFPQSHSLPNHHYAMHNGALLKYWGPLPCISEFSGERMNGILQKTKTNRRLRDLDLTMLRQMARKGRLHAILEDGVQTEDVGVRRLASILQPTTLSDSVPTPLGPAELAAFLKKAPELPQNEYNALLHYLQQTGRQFRAYDNFPHPQNAMILPPRAQRPLQLHRNGQTFSCQQSHRGNSGIRFYNPLKNSHDTGFIQSIWMVPLAGTRHPFIVVRPHRPLPEDIEGQAPFQHYPGFLSRILDANPTDTLLIIEPPHIVTHLTTFWRPAGTYGIKEETLVVCWALNRGRH